LQAARERGYANANTELKSKVSQAFKLFSEERSPVDVVIALNITIDQVGVLYREYWKLKGMYELAKIYDDSKHYHP